MIDENVAKLIFNLIPTTLRVHNSDQIVQRTLGDIPLSEIDCPTVNVSFIDGGSYSRSIDDNYKQINTYTYQESDVRSAIIRYKVGATNITNNVTETITIRSAQTVYNFKNGPVLQINSITGHAKTDYQLSSDRYSVEWLRNIPAPGETFVINYDWVDASYWVAHNIMDYIIKNILGNFRLLLNPFGIDIKNVAQVVDLSRIYVNKSLTVLAVDIKITYPFTWTIDFSPYSDSMVTLNEILIYLRRKESLTPDKIIDIKGE